MGAGGENFTAFCSIEKRCTVGEYRLLSLPVNVFIAYKLMEIILAVWENTPTNWNLKIT